MPLVTSKELLLAAQKGRYAIPAFNSENMEMAMAIVKVANEMRSPVIIQTTSSTVKYSSLKTYQHLIKSLAEQVDIPVVMHLDHGNSFELAVNAMKEGYTSVMIDGSHYDFEENIKLTKSVADIGKDCRIPVEGELGKVGGKEDEIDGGDGDKNTDPIEAAEFVKRTGVDSLAIAIGTAHGLYKGVPNIDVDRIKEITKTVDIPLVLHGTTGVDGEIVKNCVKAGMCKVNYATELRVAYSDGVKQAIKNNPSVYDPKEYGRVGMGKVEEVVRKNIKLCASYNKA
jgi:tagatose 1,6-diphosphate aldolase GatY/KbaY